MSNNELAHHGIKGQKWGVRRTKAQLGYKISSFKKKRAKKQQEKKAAAKAKEAETKPKQKSIKDMTDEELTKGINRALLEKKYRELNPEEVSSGKKFMNSMLNDVVMPAAKSSGQQFLKNYLDKVGKDILKDQIAPDEITQLKKTAEKLRLKDEINKLKNPDKTDDLTNLERKVKKLELERKYRKYTKESEDAVKKEKAEEEAKKATEKAEKEAKKATEKAEKEAKKAAEKTEKEARKAAEKETSTWDGDVEWTNFNKKSTYRETAEDIIDAEWRDLSVDDVVTNNTYQIGQNYIFGLLEDKSR